MKTKSPIEPINPEALYIVVELKDMWKRSQHYLFEMFVKEKLTGKENWKIRRDIIHHITGEYIQCYKNVSLAKTLSILRNSFKQSRSI